MKYIRPEVYVEEISSPPLVLEVPTATPAFLGYTDTAVKNGEDLTNKPTPITSFVEYQQYFGGDLPIKVKGTVDTRHNYALSIQVARHYMYESVRLFFDNGGGRCYIVSVGTFDADVSSPDFEAAVAELEKFDEPTMVVMPDAVLLEAATLYRLQALVLGQCGKLGNRFGVFDLANGDLDAVLAEFRDNIGIGDLKYGAAYAPWIITAYDRHVPFSVLEDLKDQDGKLFDPKKAMAPTTDAETLSSSLSVLQMLRTQLASPRLNTTINSETDNNEDTAAQIRRLENTLYSRCPAILDMVRHIKLKMSEVPPSGAIAGVYAYVDSTRGVWKAPANVNLKQVLAPVVVIDDTQENLTGGKSVNAIRSFSGRGTLVWGARTLAGNDNEWRYINVRRFFNMVEESVKKSTFWAVFEPNAAPLWVKLKNVIETYLIEKWHDGALAERVPMIRFM